MRFTLLDQEGSTPLSRWVSLWLVADAGVWKLCSPYWWWQTTQS